MKKTAFVLFSLFATITVSAQEVVSTQGDSYSNASGSIDFTIGEVVINTGTDGTNDLTQGFHQTNWNFLGVEDFAPSYEAIIYPNPTSDVLNIITSTLGRDRTVNALSLSLSTRMSRSPSIGRYLKSTTKFLDI